jgi:cobalt/nickel transport system permease protein
MRHDFLDQHSRGSSPVHRRPAAVKLVAAAFVVLGLVLAPRGAWTLFAVVALALLVVAGLSRIPPVFLMRRLLWLEPLALGVAVLALFQPEGWRVFLALITKSTLCLFTMILLSNTTPFAELLAVLRRLRVPALLITTLALLYRYLAVLMDEAERMRRARQARTFGRTRWSVLATVLGQLFVRSTERAERIYAAMCSRGWK